MSEYQYHEWQTIDRVLTPREQAAVDGLSSHMEVSPGKAVVIYNWSDFRHDPKEVLLDYFDAYFYMANWGSLRLMFRFPKGMLDEKELEPYLGGEYVSLESQGDYQVLDIDFNPEDGGWMEETDADLSDFIDLRADLLQGDYRLLYLTWLHEMAFYGEPVDKDPDENEASDENGDSPIYDIEPPIPAGLKKLSPALKNFVRVFAINPYLVQAAAEASPDLQNPPNINYPQWINRLSREECNHFLTRLAEDDPSAGMALRKRLGEFMPGVPSRQAAGTRTIGELGRRSKQIKETETKRQIEDARKKHFTDMQALAQQEPQAWQDVDHLLENGQKLASVYDEATAKLGRLQDLAEFQGTRDVFLTRVRALAEKFSPRPSLMKRWKERGWIG